MNPLLVMGVGLFVVFLGLFCLIGIIYLMSFIFSVVSGERKWKKIESRNAALSDTVSAPARESIVPSPVKMSKEQHRAFVAAVSAAVSEYMGTEPGALRIHSIKRVGGAEPAYSADRRELVAVIASAIAAELDTDVSGLRIHSIRKLG